MLAPEECVGVLWAEKVKEAHFRCTSLERGQKLSWLGIRSDSLAAVSYANEEGQPGRPSLSCMELRLYSVTSEECSVYATLITLISICLILDLVVHY